MFILKSNKITVAFIWLSLFSRIRYFLIYIMFSSAHTSFSNRGNVWNLGCKIKLFCPLNSFVSASWCLMLPIFHHLISKKELVANKTRSRNSQHIRKSFITLFNHVCFFSGHHSLCNSHNTRLLEEEISIYNESYISQLSLRLMFFFNRLVLEISWLIVIFLTVWIWNF